LYFAMDDMGDENAKVLMETANESEKWQLVHQFASDFGFTGIQLSEKYGEVYGLSVVSIPDHIRSAFRLTYHIGGTHQLNTADDEQHWYKMLSESLDIAKAVGAEDVSLHPPTLANRSRLPLPQNRESSILSSKAKERLRIILNRWLPEFQSSGITLSLKPTSPLVFSRLVKSRNFVTLLWIWPGWVC